MNNYRPVSEFAYPFDPSQEQLSTEEKLRAGDDFCQLVDEILLTNMEKTVITKDQISNEKRLSYWTKIHSSDQLDFLQIHITDELNEKTVWIREWVQRMGSGDLAVYSFKKDSGEVYRTHGLETPQETDDLMEALDEIVNSAENFKLRAQMGYDNQPVGVEEIQKLRQILLPSNEN